MLTPASSRRRPSGSASSTEIVPGQQPRRARPRDGRAARRVSAGHDALGPPRGRSRAPGLPLVRASRSRPSSAAAATASPSKAPALRRRRGPPRRRHRDLAGQPRLRSRARVSIAVTRRRGTLILLGPWPRFGRQRLRAGPRRHLLRVRLRGATDNRSWNSVRATGIRRRRRCPQAARRWATRHRRRAHPARRHTGSPTFTAPGRDDDRRLHAHPPAHLPQQRRPTDAPLYAIYRLSGTCSPARPLRQRDAQPPRRRRLLVRLPREQRRRAESTVRRSTFPALAGYRATPGTLQISGRLLQRQRQTAVHGGRGRRHLAPALQHPGRPSTTRPRRPRRSEALGPARRRPSARVPTRSRSTPTATAASGASRSST